MNWLLPFPARLPPGFLTDIGYETYQPPADMARAVREEYGVELKPFAPRRFVGLHWEGGAEHLALDDGYIAVGGVLGSIAYLQLLREEAAQAWMVLFRINLRSAEEPETHWLIVDRETGMAYVAPREHARQIVRQQRLEPTEAVP